MLMYTGREKAERPSDIKRLSRAVMDLFTRVGQLGGATGSRREEEIASVCYEGEDVEMTRALAHKAMNIDKCEVQHLHGDGWWSFMSRMAQYLAKEDLADVDILSFFMVGYMISKVICLQKPTAAPPSVLQCLFCRRKSSLETPYVT
jgi:hypothetical protein